MSESLRGNLMVLLLSQYLSGYDFVDGVDLCLRVSGFVSVCLYLFDCVWL